MSPVSYFDDPDPINTVKDYVQLEDLKATLELTGQAYADADIALAITAASRGIDNLANRRFYLDADANQVRYYTADDCDFLRIDDLVELTSLTVSAAGDATYGDTWVQNTDFVLGPLNAPANGWPWSTISSHPNGSFAFNSYPRAVKITGRFGWPEVPYAVKEATVVLATKLMRRAREAPFGVVSFGLEMGGAMRIARTDPDVMFLVGPYIRGRVTVA
jgi:hypothetical protein